MQQTSKLQPHRGGILLLKSPIRAPDVAGEMREYYVVYSAYWAEAKDPRAWVARRPGVQEAHFIINAGDITAFHAIENVDALSSLGAVYYVEGRY